MIEIAMGFSFEIKRRNILVGENDRVSVQVENLETSMAVQTSKEVGAIGLAGGV